MNDEQQAAVAEILPKAICKVFGGCYLTSQNVLYRFVGEQWVGKPSVQVRIPGGGWRQVWVEEAIAENLMLCPPVQRHAHLINLP